MPSLENPLSISRSQQRFFYDTGLDFRSMKVKRYPLSNSSQVSRLSNPVFWYSLNPAGVDSK
jgi:hypothetical protein